jgi:hypothetical protein
LQKKLCKPIPKKNSTDNSSIKKLNHNKLENIPFITSKIEATDFEKRKESYLEKEQEKEVVRKHRSLHNFVKTIAKQRGFKAILEESVTNGKVDVGLVNDSLKYAVEISVTNSIDYEVKNIQKCIDNSYSKVILICDNQTHLNNINNRATKVIPKKEFSKIHFITSNQFPILLGELEPKNFTTQKKN